MSRSFITENHVKESIDFSEVMKQSFTKEQRLTEQLRSLDQAQQIDLNFLRLNNHRMRRLLKTYSVSPELRHIVEQINESQIWLTLSEDFCGDSAQSLPIISKIAELNPMISLRILSRDDHLDLMDRYLTDGKRGIPKLIAIDKNFNEIFNWGPRPKEAAKVFIDSLESGKDKDEAYTDLHTWYSKDRGKAIEAEFIEILSQIIVEKEGVLAA